MNKEDVEPYLLVIRCCYYLFPLVLYLLSIKQQVNGGDGPELVISAYQLGIAHPPGYPLWTYLNKIVFSLPGSWNIIIRSSLVSCFLQCTANLLLGLTTERTLKRAQSTLMRPPGPADPLVHSLFSLAVVLVWATSSEVWTYATEPEVFAMNNMFVCLLLYVALVFCDKALGSQEVNFPMDPQKTFKAAEKKAGKRNMAPPRRGEKVGENERDKGEDKGKEKRGTLEIDLPQKLKIAFLGSFLCGLAMTNQQTILFFEIPIICWVLYIGRRYLLKAPVLLKLLQFYVLGLSFYLLLPLAQFVDRKQYSWGDVTTLSGFLSHILRSDYGTLQLYKSDNPTERFINWIFYGVHTYREYGWIGMVLSSYGFVWFLRDGYGKVLASCYCFYITVFFWLSNLPIQNPIFASVFMRFFPQIEVIFVIWIGVGGYLVYENIHKSMEAYKNHLLLLTIALLLFTKIFFVVPVHLEYSNTTKSILSDFGQAVLSPLPENSILLLQGDLQTNLVFYKQICEGYRKDVKLLSINHMTYYWFFKQSQLYEDVIFPGKVYHPQKQDGYNIAQFILANIKYHPIFICGSWKEGDDSHTVFHLKNLGITQQVLLAPPNQDIKVSEENYLNTLIWPISPLFGYDYAAPTSYLNSIPTSTNYTLFSESLQIPSTPIKPKKYLLPGTWEREALLIYYYEYHNFVHDVLQFGLNCKSKETKMRAIYYAIKMLTEMKKVEWLLDTNLNAQVYYHLGVSYDNLKMEFKQESKEFANCVHQLIHNWSTLKKIDNEIARPLIQQIDPSLSFWINYQPK